jgi:1-acyl-sn-glycerol-3-phosphate acyltransferase
MFAKIRFYWGAFVIASVILLLMVPLVTLFPSHKGIIMHRLNRFILWLIGGKLKQVGTMDLGADFYLMNHQGIIDIIGMEALQQRHFRWIAKKELFDMPLFGRLLKNGDMISIERENKKGLIGLMRDVRESLEIKNRPVAIFPEGTRAKGQSLLPFKAGAQFIAHKMKLKVQPVVITNSKRLINEHDKSAHSATVYYHFLPTIDLTEAPEHWYEQMRKTMQQVIDDELAYHHRSR